MTKIQPVSEKYIEMMNTIAAGLDDVFAPAGFVLLVFDNSDPGDQTRVNYISNCDRADMLVAMKEVVARFEGRAHSHTTVQ